MNAKNLFSKNFHLPIILFSTYISNNITIPASFIEDNYEPSVTVHGPGSYYSQMPISIGHNQYNQNNQQSSYFSPGRSSHHYGSFLGPGLSPLTEDATIQANHSTDPEDYLGTSYTSNRVRRNSAAEGNRRQTKIPEQTTPLVRTISKSSFTSIPISIMQDVVYGDAYAGSNFRQSIFNSINILIGK